MNAVGLAPKHERNLRRLAAYLLSGPMRARFDMSDYADSANMGVDSTSCGTVGCAIGHGPDAGIEKLPAETWMEYSDRVFISPARRRGDGTWGWCFDSDWYRADNMPSGAARRILWLLEHGLPDDWYSQVYGDEPLCYENFEITSAMLDWQSLITEAPDAVA